MSFAGVPYAFSISFKAYRAKEGRGFAVFGAIVATGVLVAMARVFGLC